jgi:hypothetical protein
MKARMQPGGMALVIAFSGVNELVLEMNEVYRQMW